MCAAVGSVRAFARDIRLEHSLFALPFGLLGAWRGAGDALPASRTMVLIVVAMVAARTAAMGWNRIVDAPLDAQNPRTQDRAIPRGAVSPGTARGVVAGSAILFLASAALLHPTAGRSAPFVLAILLGYSYAKRFTVLSHLWLGLALGLAPLGGEVAVAGRLSPSTIALGVGVLCWVAGFDILYATMDLDFDRARGLHAIPARWGVSRALCASCLLQAGALVAFAWAAPATPRAALCLATLATLLAYEQWLVSPGDLSRVPRAFFSVNAWLGWIAGVGFA